MHSAPSLSVEEADALLRATWPKTGCDSFELPADLLTLGAEGQKTMSSKLIGVARLAARAATQDERTIAETVENFSIYLETAIDLQDALQEDGHLVLRSDPDPEVQAILDAAKAEGREADFAEVLMALHNRVRS